MKLYSKDTNTTSKLISEGILLIYIALQLLSVFRYYLATFILEFKHERDKQT